MSDETSSATLIDRGKAHLAAGNLADAEHSFRSLLTRDPGLAEAWHGLGIIAHQTRHLGDALMLFDRAIALAPTFAAAHVNRGNTLNAMARFADAIEAYRRALQLAPDLASAHSNLANALQPLGRIDEAVASLERALTLQPDLAEAFNNLANLYKEQGRLGDALDAYAKALALEPEFREAFSNKLAALKLSTLHTPEQVFQEHRRFAAWFETVYEAYQLPGNNPDPDRQLRIGYVSPDCHPAVPAFVRPVLRCHARDRFEIHCYFNNPQAEETDPDIRARVTPHVLTGLSDERVAEQVRADAIDILIDIAGHTGKNRLGVFMRKPAPIQINWLDYLNTTGLDTIDYRITDGVADPPGASDSLHTEKLLRLAGSQWCYEPDPAAPAVASLPALASGYLTFGSFNNFTKLTDATLVLWSKLLAAAPDARLLLAGVPEGLARERVTAFFARNVNRITFLQRVSVAEYRNAYSLVDIVLDPFPFSGATTTLDALWQGVPVLTLPGEFSASRSSASLLTQLGLSDWIARDEPHYLALATRWRDDLAALAQLRDGLRERVARSALTDAQRFTRELEGIYRDCWKRWCMERRSAAGATGKVTTRAQADVRLIEARATLERGDCEKAISELKEVLCFQPNWKVAQSEFARALLEWARTNPALASAVIPPAPISPKRASVSVIVCSIRPDQLARLRRRYEELFAQHDLEIVAITDAKSLCEGYNRGAERARGEVLIFSHDDIDFATPDLASRLLAHLDASDVVGVAGTSRLQSGDWRFAGFPNLHGQVVHQTASGFAYLACGLSEIRMQGIEALDGVFFALRRSVWDALRFDEATFDGFHLYDVDFTFRASQAGFRVVVAADLLVLHQSLGKFDRSWQRYNRRFLDKFSGLLSGEPSVQRLSSLHIRVRDLEQVAMLRAALLHHRFGARVNERVMLD